MKLDKKIHKKLVKNLKEWRNNLVKQIDIDLYLIENAASRDVEHIMNLKAEMIARMIDNCCLKNRHCYFCLKHMKYNLLDCSKCEYGKYNGICNEKNSIYYLIQVKLDSLKKIIKAFYPKFS